MKITIRFKALLSLIILITAVLFQTSFTGHTIYSAPNENKLPSGGALSTETKPESSTVITPIVTPSNNRIFNRNSLNTGSYLSRERVFQDTLPNGMRIVIQERAGTGIVSLELLVRAGVMQEMDTYAGITSIIQAMLINGGNDSHIPLQELGEIEGGIIDSGVQPDYAYISMLTSNDSFKDNLIRLAKVIKEPVFTQEMLDIEKTRHVYQLNNSKNAFQMINEIFLKQFYRYHPYRQPIYGFESTVNRLTLEDIEKFYHQFYTANRMTLAICGDVKGVDTLELSKKLFSSMPKKSIKSVVIPWEPEGQEQKLYLQTTSDTAWLFVGFPAPEINSPDYPAAKVLETLLGDGLSSRLFIELREKEGLAYELSSSYPRLTGPSHMILYVITSGPNLSKSRRKLFQEINKLKQWHIGEEELEATKRKVLGKYLLEREKAMGRAHNLAYFAAFSSSPTFDETLLRRINSVTVEDVRNIARKYLENYTVLEVSPPSEGLYFR